MKKIKLKSQPKWIVRVMFGVWIVAGLWVALHIHPIVETSAQIEQGHQSSATSDYMHYETVDGIGTISICDPSSNWTKCITMKDRNEWATIAGTECSELNSGACGYHFQRWNNHGFAPCLSNRCNIFPNGETKDGHRVDCEWYGPTIPFEDSIFRAIIYDDYCLSWNDNMWWWSWDSQENDRWYPLTLQQAENRRWPCDTWYHVPSIWEWNQLLEYWAKENEINFEDYIAPIGPKGLYNSLKWLYDDSYVLWLKFQEDFKVPFAGYRDYYPFAGYSDSIARVYIGELADLWSSSPYWYYGFARVFGLSPDWVSADRVNVRSYAFSVRCFKDSYLSFPTPTVTVNFWDWETGNPACSGEVFSWKVVSRNLKACADWLSRQWYILAGRYEDENFTKLFDLENTIVMWNLDLYAKWRLCGEWFVVKDNKCIPVEYEKHLNWVIEVTDWNDTMYIRDRNAWWVSDAAVKYLKLVAIENQVYNTDNQYYNQCYNRCGDDWGSCFDTCMDKKCIAKVNEEFKTNYTSIDEIYEFYGELILDVLEWLLSEKEMEAVKIGIRSDYLEYTCNRDEMDCDEYINVNMLDYVNEILGTDFDNIYEARDYVYDYFWEEMMEIVWNYSYLAEKQAYWNYYFRWNNSWVSYNELEFDGYGYGGDVITNMDSLIERWFNWWNIWDDAWNWWVEWQIQDNPCDSEKWEYLPTSQDWVKLMKIWANKNEASFYEVEPEIDLGWNFEFIDRDSFDKFQQDMLIPWAWFIEYWWYEGNDVKLRTSQDENGYIWDFGSNRLGIEYFHDDDLIDWDNNQINNNVAYPVRCFVNLAEIPDVYVVSFSYNTTEWNVIRDTNVIWWDTIILFTPSKDWYRFVWWYIDKELTKPFVSSNPVTEDIVLYAKWEKEEKPSVWWGSRLKKDKCPNWDYSDSYYDWTCEKQRNTKNEDNYDYYDSYSNYSHYSHNSADELVYDTFVFDPYYSDEMNQAYQFSYYYWITTKNTIKNANMGGKLTRIAMAKMLSQYAINVLWMTPDPDNFRNCSFSDVTKNMDVAYDNWATLACQLWIMWINIKSNRFRPNDYVTRAEFATALSRLLYGTPDWYYESTVKYYVPHLSKLAYEWIITNTDPTMKEVRGYVMTILMRSVDSR